MAERLEGSIDQIIGELADAQGDPVDIGGYFHPDVEKASKAMRPSATFNEALSAIAAAAA